VSSWKSRRGLTDDAVKGHSCSGSTCLYTQIGDAYICEKTGRVHGIYFNFLPHCLVTCELCMPEMVCFFFFQYAMMHVVNLSWTNLVGYLSVLYPGTASRGFCVLMMNGTLVIL
jgi:hypothetical protein